MGEAFAVALLIACVLGLMACGLMQFSIISEMEIRLGDPPNLSFLRLLARQRSFAIEKEFRQRYPGDHLIRRLRTVKIILFACLTGAAILLFGVLPHWAPTSRPRP